MSLRLKYVDPGDRTVLVENPEDPVRRLDTPAGQNRQPIQDHLIRQRRILKEKLRSELRRDHQDQKREQRRPRLQSRRELNQRARLPGLAPGVGIAGEMHHHFVHSERKKFINIGNVARDNPEDAVSVRAEKTRNIDRQENADQVA